MRESRLSASLVVADTPIKQIMPRLPFAFAFALGDPMPAESIPLGEVVEVMVHDGTPSAGDRHDWFAVRVPARPAATGPLAVAGIVPDERIELEVLAIEADCPDLCSPPRVTLAVAGSGAHRGEGPLQVIVPAGSAVHLKARGTGALLSVGPVLARSATEEGWRPIPARVLLRCTGL